jgi:hypothetical protein
MDDAAYKKLVERTRVADAGGTWTIAFFDSAKYPAACKNAYKYLVCYHARSGQVTFVSGRPPRKGSSENTDPQRCDDRAQLSADDLLAMIEEAKRMFVPETTHDALTP